MATVPLCPTVEDFEKLSDEKLANLEAFAAHVLANPDGGSPSSLTEALAAVILAKPYFLDRVKVARFLKAGA